MTVEIGHFALVLALIVALVQTVAPLIGARRNDAALMAAGNPLAMTQFFLVAVSFGALCAAYMASDFSVRNVWENSHTLKPMLYKFTGVWGNHEGSMLLWVLILAIFGASVPAFGRHLPSRLKANVIAVQGSISVAFLTFIIFTSNPFLRLNPAPFEGRDLNPILQDVGLAIHPPLLYLGYVGFSITFAFAVAALIEGRVDSAWARWVRPWALAAWLFLTLGISMGSYWAYYELGWGGWWFWDPVENASLMPWLSGTALLHSAIVVEKRNALKVWTILLAIITFSLSLLGTFLVRSGVLTSVHTFATDPARGMFILMILMVFIGGSLTLFAARANAVTGGGLFAPVSREGALVFNNLFLSAACATVFVGTLYPLFHEALTGAKISVGPPFFNLTVLPLCLPLLLAIPFGPFLTWKRADLAGVAQRLMWVAGLALVAAIASAAMFDFRAALSAVAIGLGVWLMAGAIAELLYRARFEWSAPADGLRRLFNLPRAQWGAMLGHLGVGVMVLGIAGHGWRTEVIEEISIGETVKVAAYELRLERVEQEQGPNYVQDVAVFSAARNGVQVEELRPAKRIYPARQMPTTEAGIETRLFSQLYVSVGEVRDGGRTIVARLYHKPFITLIWIGTLIMALGGAVSLADRRLRIGVPKAARARGSVEGAAA
ncbi:MAG: heme lyase CcmF/NrfE family subunit [Rhizobiaceae bacterium]|jgi:cytochrome c-type biogenesis protein CcmF|nr:heme lyase CcmF/NrfE family subunit [Rhizobiaceae bacterium]